MFSDEARKPNALLKTTGGGSNIPDEPADNVSSRLKWTLWVTSYGRMIYEFWIAVGGAGSRGAPMFGIVVAFTR